MVQRRLQDFWYGLLVRLIRPDSYAVVMALVFIAYVLAFVSKWAIVWALLTAFAPGWLLPDAAAVSTAAQVLPALMVSVFVFVLASFFVVTQQVTTIHSNRGSLLLLYDTRIQQAVARPLVLSVATLLLALLSPASNVSAGVAALTLALMLATAFTLGGSAALLPYLIAQVTAPTNFALYVLANVDEFLRVGATGMVVFRVGLFGEMLKRGIRTGDSLQLRQALNGIDRFHRAYIEAAAINPAARVHQYDAGREVTGWLSDELVGFLVSAGEEAIREDIASEDGNRIATTTAGFGKNSAEAGHREEYLGGINALGELATCTQQMKAPGMVNIFSEPVWGLATLVKAGMDHLDEEAAATALATWALAIAYAARHLTAPYSPEHVFWKRGLASFGSDAPFDPAHDVLDSDDFQGLWVNKLMAIAPAFDFSTVPPTEIGPGGVDGVHDFLRDAEVEATGIAANK